MANSIGDIARKLTLGIGSHGPAGKPAVRRRSRMNSNKYSGGGGRRAVSGGAGAERLANLRRGPAGPNFNPPQREPRHYTSGGGGRRRKN